MSDPQGSARDADPSAAGLYLTLGPVALTAAVYLSIFLILRKNHKRFYAPRTYLGSLRHNERSPPLPNGFFNWFGAFWKISDYHPLQHQSLDAYLFLRFMKILIVICFVGCCITWPVLFPVNITGGAGQTELNLLSYSNVDKDTQYNRYYAHTFIAWIFYGFVMYMVVRESIFYVNLRQAFLLSPMYSDRISSRTVLFVSVPDEYLDKARLRKVFGDSVKNIWIAGETKELDESVKERDKVAMKLEQAEVKLLKLANAQRLKAIKKGAADERPEAPADAEPGSLAARWVPPKKRPSHRLGFLGLVGKKVDTIEWCRTQLKTLIPTVDEAQKAYRDGNYKKVGSVFVEFTNQADAESAYQVLAHHQALQMSPKYIGITPDEVVWSALKVSWWQRIVRRFAVIGFISALIIFWAIPVAVVGIISNINSLSKIVFLQWIQLIPQVILGFVQGLLPSVLMAVLLSLVPIIMRLCAKLAGEPSLSRVELFTQNAYFAFQVIQVFLITTLTSAASAVGYEIFQHPEQVTSLLAENLPKASNFYISYFIVQGLGIAASVVSQVAGFVVFNLIYKFLSGTPRSLYTQWATLSAISWGSVLPVYTNIAVISIAYAGIAPLVLGFATIGISIFYLAWRYNIFFVTDTKIDTRGLIYPRALKQLFTGVYIAELSMIGIFATSVAIGPLILMIIFLVFTALLHITVNSAIDPLLYNLPRTLAEAAAQRKHSGSVEEGEKDVGDAENSNGSSPNAASEKKVGIVAKFFKPWEHCDYETLRKLVPEDGLDVYQTYTDEVQRDAYYPPSVTSPTPLLWIPSDPLGISKQEVHDTGKVIPITDEGCTLDDKNKLQWDEEGVRPPVWEEKIYY
ncbi:putative phosphate metabolism protein 7 protein [Rosellinia necatrix]|uniref:Putative phosphate metabolism protein 7 protein n=1 Tax=Rosellinia necatrix TaxID=77044 RepID=A0A1S7UHN1_ROSNE|nr:putative phosphate metabolism protein 7 protein [Rosellinia necatrix]